MRDLTKLRLVSNGWLTNESDLEIGQISSKSRYRVGAPNVAFPKCEGRLNQRGGVGDLHHAFKLVPVQRSEALSSCGSAKMWP